MTMTVLPRWTLGERLQKARKDARVGRRQIAGALGVSEETVRSWEADRREPRGLVAVLLTYASLTGVPAEWLLHGGQPEEAMAELIKCLHIAAMALDNAA